MVVPCCTTLRHRGPQVDPLPPKQSPRGNTETDEETRRLWGKGGVLHILFHLIDSRDPFCV